MKNSFIKGNQIGLLTRFQSGHKINLGKKNHFGFKHSENSKSKMSNKTSIKKGQIGDKSPAWKGGIKRDRRPYHMKRAYGIETGKYEEMFAKQNGLCAICKQKSGEKYLSIDHNHETGEIRGLLCKKCNMGLGMFRDSVLILTEAIKYLNK